MSETRKTIRAGIIGSGFAARFHVEALRKVYGVQVGMAGVYSPTGENCRKFAQETGLKQYDSLASLVDASDVVHVCTPPSSHEEIGVEVLKQGKYVVIEKPFTGYFGAGDKDFSGDRFNRQSGLEQANQSVQNLLKAESESSGQICYAENWVYAPSVQKEREIIENRKKSIAAGTA